MEKHTNNHVLVTLNLDVFSVFLFLVFSSFFFFYFLETESLVVAPVLYTFYNFSKNRIQIGNML